MSGDILWALRVCIVRWRLGGCSFSGRCIVMTPFQIGNNSTLAEIVAADNYASTNTNVDQLVFTVRQPDAASQALDTSAVWTVSAEVPIPAAAWLFGSGLIGLLGIARRKKAAKQFTL